MLAMFRFVFYDIIVMVVLRTETRLTTNIEENEAMRELLYLKPAATWYDALPVGNGWLGAMCFGGTTVDRWQLNDDTVWSGGFIDRVNPDAAEAIPRIRQLIEEGRIAEAEELIQTSVVANPEGQRSYQPLCDLVIQFRRPAKPRYPTVFLLNDLNGRRMDGYEPEEGVADYRRTLCLTQGIHHVSYVLDGVEYERETFSSFPAGVMAIRLKGREWRALLRRGGRVTAQRHLDDRTLCLEGATGNDGIRFCCVLRSIAGEAVTRGDMLLGGGDGVLLISSATDFRDGEDYLAAALQRIDAAERRGYEALKAEHIADLQPIMEACTLEIEEEDASLRTLPHDERIARVQKGERDLGLINDLFAYGRYLLASSSRPGTLPATLQGLWNEDYTPAWDSKYTININAQMNYWPAENCALSPMQEPFFQLIRRKIDASVREPALELSLQHILIAALAVHLIDKDERRDVVVFEQLP